MKTWIVFLLIGLAGAWRASAELQLSGSPNDLAAAVASVPGQIPITASAEVEAEANRAMVRLAVTTKDRSLQKAFEKNRAVRDDIVQTITAKGWSKDAVKVSRFSTTPQFGSFSKQKPDAYEVSSSVEIFIGNENELQTVTAFVDTRPEVTLRSLTFEHTDKDSLQRKALELALDKINAQKKLFEDKLGATLRARGLPAGVMAAGNLDGNIEGLPNYVAGATPAVRFAKEAGATDISQFERITYRVQLTLVFDVLAKDAGK